MAQTDANALHVRMLCLQMIEKNVNGRLVGTRTPDLYRVKGQLTNTLNNVESYGDRLSTPKYV